MYCTTCGSELVFKERKIAGYKSETGEPLYAKIWKCPKMNFWFDWVYNLSHTNDTIYE